MQSQPNYPQIKGQEKKQFALGESRKDLLVELRSYGFAVQNDYFDECTMNDLQVILKSARWLYAGEDNGDKDSAKDKKAANSLSRVNNTNFHFTEIDKEMLQTLISSNGRISSLALSRKLDVPLTTVQRRRKRLESEFLEFAYSLKLDKLGWRRADLLVSTHKGMTSAVGKELLAHSGVTTVSRAIGEHTIDLHAEVVFKNNAELLNLIEWIKSFEGVKDVIWTEPVETMGRNGTVPQKVIEQL
jgi:DNA-binding Lrp family transcriptional regulator